MQIECIHNTYLYLKIHKAMMTLFENSEPVIHKHNGISKGDVLSLDELQTFAVDALFSDYKACNMGVTKYPKNHSNEPDLRLSLNDLVINILVVYSPKDEIPTHKVDVSVLMSQYYKMGIIPRIIYAYSWSLDSEDGKSYNPSGGSYCFKYHPISLLPEQTNCEFANKLDKDELIKKFAQAWTMLDISFVKDYLDKDFHYKSDLAFDELPSRYEYLNYIEEKFQKIRDANTKIVVKLMCDEKSNGFSGLLLIPEGSKSGFLQIETSDGYILSAQMMEYDENNDTSSSNNSEEEMVEAHGDRLQALMDPEKFVRGTIQKVLEEGKDVIKVKTLCQFEGDSRPESTNVFSVKYTEDQMSILALLGHNKRKDTNEFISTLFNFQGSVYTAKIIEVKEWTNHIEAIVKCSVGGFEFCFLATDYYLNKHLYKKGNNLNLELFTYSSQVEKPSSDGFTFEGQQALDYLSKIGVEPKYDKDGNVMPIEFSTKSLVAFLQTYKEYPDGAEFQSPIIYQGEMNFLEHKFIKYNICISKEPDICVPLYIRKELIPKMSDLTSLLGMLFVSGSITDKKATVIQYDEDSSDNTQESDTSSAINGELDVYAKEYLSYLNKCEKEGLLDKFDDIEFIRKYLSLIGIKEGYCLDAFRCGDRVGSMFKFYACQIGSTVEYIPEPPKKKSLLASIFSKKRRYTDDKYIGHMLSDEDSEVVPDYFNYLTVPFTEIGVWQAYLLKNTPSLLTLWWHAAYNRFSYIFTKKDLLSAIKHQKDIELADKVTAFSNQEILIPKVVINGNKAIVSCCKWNDWVGLYQEFVEITKKGNRVHFSEPVRKRIIGYSSDIMF